MCHFECIAGAGGERLAHVGDECRGRKTRAIGDVDEALGQGLGILFMGALEYAFRPWVAALFFKVEGK